jgi:hypothetical protein
VGQRRCSGIITNDERCDYFSHHQRYDEEPGKRNAKQTNVVIATAWVGGLVEHCHCWHDGQDLLHAQSRQNAASVKRRMEFRVKGACISDKCAHPDAALPPCLPLPT